MTDYLLRHDHLSLPSVSPSKIPSQLSQHRYYTALQEKKRTLSLLSLVVLLILKKTSSLLVLVILMLRVLGSAKLQLK